MRICAFDFDGTLTVRDTLIEFIRFACGTRALLAGFALYSPLLALMKLRLYPNHKAKQRLFAHYFAGMREEEFNRLCRGFAVASRRLLRPAGVRAVERAKAAGAKVLIVSASIDNWVAPFFEGVTVIGTRIEVCGGRVSGRFLGGNCYGGEKARRILELYPDRTGYHLTAFGDSRGDREMLAMADERHYKPFREG